MKVDIHSSLREGGDALRISTTRALHNVCWTFLARGSGGAGSISICTIFAFHVIVFFAKNRGSIKGAAFLDMRIRVFTVCVQRASDT